MDLCKKKIHISSCRKRYIYSLLQNYFIEKNIYIYNLLLEDGFVSFLSHNSGPVIEVGSLINLSFSHFPEEFEIKLLLVFSDNAGVPEQLLNRIPVVLWTFPLKLVESESVAKQGKDLHLLGISFLHQPAISDELKIN